MKYAAAGGAWLLGVGLAELIVWCIPGNQVLLGFTLGMLIPLALMYLTLFCINARESKRDCR